jgi:pantothenate kinase
MVPFNQQQTIKSWEPEMAQRIQLELTNNKRMRPYMIALVGCPGSGKSVSAMILADALQKAGISCFVMPHDGYHYTLEYLQSLIPDAADLVYRRGAPDTFDARALHRDLLSIRNGNEEIVTLPAFDHARGDPEPDAHMFERGTHEVVVCEGLYLLHDQDGWDDIKQVFDFSIFINTDIETCMERVKIRNQCKIQSERASREC